MHYESNAIPSAFLLSITLGLGTSGFAQDADISQLTFLDPVTFEVTQPYSRAFRVGPRLDPANEAHRQLLEENGGGYLNVFVRLDPFDGEIEWIVQNDFELLPDETWLDSDVSSYLVGLDSVFNTPEGIPIEWLEYAQLITPEPIDEPPLEIEFIPLPVEEETYAPQLGGRISNLDDVILDDPLPREVWGKFLTQSGPGTLVDCWNTHIPSKLVDIPEEDPDECIPGSTTASVSMLSQIWNFSLGPGGVQGLHDAYTQAMDTNDCNPAIEPNDNHRATTFISKSGDNVHTPALNGRNAVNQSPVRGYRIVSTQSGPYNIPQNPPGTVQFPDAWTQPFPDLKGSLDECGEFLQRGGDVELGLRWASGGQHQVMMVQVCKYEITLPGGGSTFVWKIKYIDENQTTPGVQKTRNTIWVFADGSFRFNDNLSTFPDGHLVWLAKDRYYITEDLNRDGEVNGADLGLLMAGFGFGSGSGDIDGDGDVDGADLGRLLGKWGPVLPE